MKNLPKSLLLSVALIFIWTSVQSQELPRPSQLQKVTQRVGLTDIIIEYSRPNAKDRVIFGDLVPYGKVWRTGANAATTIEINSSITVQGQELVPGKYAIFTMPQDGDDWQIMINSQWEQWGSRGYKSEFDVVSVSAPVQKMKDYTETFTIGFDHVIGDNAELFLIWANTRVNIKIEADSKAQATENVNKKIEELDNTYGAYNSIARHFLTSNEPAEALKYAEKSVAMHAEFWNLKTLSEAYAANHNYPKAIEVAEKSLVLSQEAGNKSYEKQNMDNLAKWKSM